MSTLKVTNIQDTAGGNSSTSAQIYSGRAKAWVNASSFSTMSINGDAYNVSSLTDLGVGVFQINFSTSFSDKNYIIVHSTSTGNSGVYSHVNDSQTTTSKCEIHTKSAHHSGQTAGVYYDTQIYVSIFD